MLGQVLYIKSVQGLWSWRVTLWLSEEAIISAHTLYCASAFGRIQEAMKDVEEIAGLLNIKLLQTKTKKVN